MITTELPPVIGIPLFVILGLVMGSFATVLIERVPMEQSIGGRSRCPHCGTQLRIIDLIPLLSFLILRGRCYRCSTPIGLRYPLVELASTTIFVVAYVVAGGLWFLSMSLALTLWALLVIAIIDLRTKLIPDVLTLAVAIAGFLSSYMTGAPSPLVAALVGLGFTGFLWIMGRGQWMGSGDALLAGAIGLFVGSWEKMLVALFTSFVLGGFIALVILLNKRSQARGMHIPFGPFLVVGAVVGFFFGDILIQYVLPF